MVTAQEITVALRSTGTQEVADDVSNVEQEFDEASDTVGDSAAEMEGFSTEFAGAMTAIVTGLAVAAAGLLSQVPVVGELFAGLGAVLEAVAFQMDQVLRPVLQPLNEGFFALASGIFNADGAVGTLIGGLSTIVSVAALVLGAVLSAVGVLSQLGLTSLTVGGVLSTLAGAIGSVVTAIVAAVSWPVVLAAALIGLAFVFRKEIANAIGVAISALGDFISWLGDGVGQVWTALGEIGSAFVEWADGLISSALQWGKDLIDNFIQGIRNGIGELRSIVNGLSGGAINLSGSSGGGGGGGGGGGLTANRGNVTVKSFIDGREAARGTSATRFDETSRRGTFR